MAQAARPARILCDKVDLLRSDWLAPMIWVSRYFAGSVPVAVWRAVSRAGGGHRRFFDEGERAWLRSEEHTSELQSLMRISYAVFCLKKNKKSKNTRRKLS